MGLSAVSFLSREYLCILRRCAWYNAFNYFVAVSSAFYGVSATADQITIDGRTQTELSINGSVTDITTQTIKGANALNSFHRFNIGGGQTVNLYLPNGTANLLNLVHDERSQLDGVMNAYKDGRIGGNVFFLNPHGIVVGAEGSINVGSLTMATPTPQFMNSLIAATGQVNAGAIDNVLSGKIPLTESGLIQVKGRINAVDSIHLNAGQVMVDASSHLIAGMQAQANFGDLVNIDGIEVGSEVKIENGVISILAMGDVDVAGQIAVDGIEGQNAGLVEIKAGQDIHLNAGADVSASGQGLDSSGGVVISYAQGDATLEAGAVVAANGGLTGDGGFVEFSAKDTVNINGGKLQAKAPQGKAGEILIDPAELLWTGSGNDQFKDGESYTITATDRVVLDDVVISTRKLDSADDNRANVATATSTGDSGDFTIKSTKIELKNGAAIYAQADGGFTGGKVTLEARDEAVLPSLGWATATAQIDIGNATIKADEVLIDAKSNIDSQFVYSSEDPLDSALNVTTATAQQVGGFLLSLGGVELVVSDVDAKAYVNLTSGANIEATNGVTLTAENVTKAGMAKQLPSPGVQFNTPVGIGALWVSDKSDAKVTVSSGVTIKSKDLSVLAHNDASLEGSIASAKNQSENSSFTAIAAGITQADVKADVNIASGVVLNVSGNLTLAATNVGSYSNEVVSETGPNGRAAAAVAYSDHQSGVNASLNADVGDATKVEIIAINDVLKDQTTAFSKVGGSQIDSIIASGSGKVSAMTGAEDFFWGKLGLKDLKPDNKSSPTQQSFRIGGAIAYDTSTHSALAEIGDDTSVHVTDSVAVVSRVRAEDMKIAAQAAAVSTSSKKAAANDTARQAYSVGLSIANYHHDAISRVGENATVTASKVAVYSDTILPIRDSLLFGSKASTDSWSRWDGLESIKNALDSITNIFDVFNGVSSAKSTSDNSDGSINLSGSVGLLNYDDKSRAIVDTGAKINVTGSETGAWSTSMSLRPEKKNYDELTGAILLSTDLEVKEDFEFAAPVSIQAKHDATLLFQAGELLPSASGEKGLGIAFNNVDVTTKTEAIVREGVVIQGITETADAEPVGSRTWTPAATTFEAEQVVVSAENKERIISLAISGGYGGTFGVNGTFSQMSVDDSTHALVDDEVTVKSKILDVTAESSPVVWSLSGGINMSKNVSVGIGIAINDALGSTRSEIADNDMWSLDDTPRTSLVSVAGAKITSHNIDVTAKTGGRLEAIAVTGAIANNAPNPPGEEGIIDKIKSKTGYTSAMTTAESLAGVEKSTVSSQNASSPEQEKEKKPVTYSFAGAGSGAINVTEMLTTAKIENVTIEQTASTAKSLVVRAISDSDITAAAGAAAITRANDPDTTSTVGVAGSGAVNSIGNGTQAWLKDSTVTNANDVTVQALSGGEQLAIALGMAVNVSSGPAVEKSDSFVGSLSLTLAQTDDNGDSKNKTVAKIDSSDITGSTMVNERDVDVTAYNRTYIGTGAGSLNVQAGSAKKGTSIGGAVSWANVRNDVSASIVGGSDVTNFDTVSVRAYNATEIGAGAAMGGISTAAGANSFAGSLVFNQITNNTTAAIEKSTVTATGLVDVEARDKGADAALETLIDPDGDRDNTVKGLDYCGESASGASPSGNCIAAVAGTVQLGSGNNVGISISYNQIVNNLTAKVKDSAVTVTGADTTDKINVLAESDTSILGVAFGIGLSTSKASGAGSISIASIKNTVTAEVAQSETAGSATTLNAPTVTVSSTDDSIIQTVAGQVNVSTSDKALGAAFAYNEINNGVHAIVDTATITASNAVAIAAQENAKIESLSASAGLASGTAVSLSASLNFIDNTSEARLSNGTIKDGSTTGGTNTVKITATDGSYETTIDPTKVNPTIEEQLDDQYSIRSIAGSVGGSYSGAGVGAAFSLNQVSNANKVLVENSTIEGAKVLELKALEKAIIRTFAGAVGAGQSGFSGSITLNNIGQSFVGSNPNSTTAELNNTTVSGGAGSSIKVEGTDDSMIESYAGALSIGAGGSAIGGAIADNNIQTTAKGSITNSTISDSASLDVAGLNTSKIKSASIAAAGGSASAFGGSASSNRTENNTYGEIIGSDITGSSSVVSVKATNESDIQALSGGAAVSFSSGAVGLAISVNDIDDTTSAHVTGKKVSGSAVKDMQVAAASDATIKALSIGAAGASGIAAAGSVGVSLISSTTSAYIDDGAVVLAENNVGVTAESDDAITVISGSAGISFGAGGVGVGLNVNSITSTTKAYISGADTSVTGLAKGAAMEVYNGELTAGVNLENQVDTLTYAALDLKNSKATESISGVAVNASSSQQIENITGTIGASAGIGAGVAAGVNVIGGTTEAYVLNAKINDNNTDAGATQQVDINASNIAYDNSFIVAVGIGANAGGLGIDTHVMNRTTSAKVTGGSINAKDTVAVKAKSTQGISSLAAGGAAGGNAGAGTLALALFDNTTEAIVSGAHVTASDLEIEAKNTNDMFLMAGAVSIGGNAGGGAFAVGASDSTTKATLSTTTVTVDGAVKVDAINKTDINHIVVSGAGGGGTGVAGMADVNLVTDQTLATIENSTIGSVGDKATTVHVAATHTLDVDSKAGALGVGISGGGVGAGASINIIKANTVATVSGSTIYANGHMDVTAVSTKHVDATALTAGVGGTVGIGGAAVVTLVGDDVSGDAADEVDGSLSAVDEFTADGFDFNNLPPTGAGGPEILSDADQTSLNSDTSKSTTDVTGSAGGYAFKTAAEIKGTNTINSGSLDVIATDKTDTKTLVGGFGASLGGGIGGGVAVTNVKANVAANVSGTALTTNGNINVKATADNDTGKTIEILALAGGAGLVGIGAAVSFADISNHVDANLSSGADAGTGTVTVSAEDKTDIESDAKGAAVGAAAAGAVYSETSKNSTINAAVGGIIRAAAANISASDSGFIDSLGQSAAGGLGVGLSGAFVNASDDSTITALTANNTTFHLGSGALNMTATSTPRTEAEADGIAVSGGLAIGASLADASINTTINATLGSSNTVNAGGFNLTAQQLRSGTEDSAKSTAWAASGGLLLGASATTSDADAVVNVNSRVGSNSTLNLGSGTATVTASVDSQQSSKASGINVGFVAAGFNDATATSTNTIYASLGSGVKVTAGTLNINSGGSDNNLAEAIAGSGGVLAGSASEGKTISFSDTRAYIEGSTDDRNITVNNFALTADHTAKFNSTVDSTNASVVGASGAFADNFNDANVWVGIGDGVNVEAINFDVNAYNRTRKTLGSAFNVVSASGGLFDAAATHTASIVLNDTDVEIGEGVTITIDAENSGRLSIKAMNDVELYDSAKMDSGGAVALAKAEAFVYNDQNDADITLGKGTLITSDENITLETLTTAIADSEVNSKTYGLAGAAEGHSISRIDTSNNITLNGARLETDESVFLKAGHNNDLKADAETRIYNRTLIPADTDPDADGIITQDNKITINAYVPKVGVAPTGTTSEEQIDRAAIATVKDINLQAGEGVHITRGYGTGTDLYRETAAAAASLIGITLSTEIKGGSVSDNSQSSAEVNGTIFAGTHFHQILEIDQAGTIIQQSEGMADPTYRYNVDLARDIDTRIAALQLLVNEYQIDNPDIANGFKADIDILNAKRSRLGVGVTATFMDIAPAVANTGYIYATGDSLIGTGELLAPGDAKIEIINNSNAFVSIGKYAGVDDTLFIPGDLGGVITLNGVRVSNKDEINAINKNGQTAGFTQILDRQTSEEPVIRIENTYEDPINLNALNPEVHIDGDITNIRGLVEINSAGSVQVSSNILAKTIVINTKGDFIKTFTTGFTHQGGDPTLNVPNRYGPAEYTAADGKVYPYTLDLYYEDLAKRLYPNSTLPPTSGTTNVTWNDSVNTPALSSVIAGQNVFISGEKLNINGLIQSGLPSFDVNISQTLANQAIANNGVWTSVGMRENGELVADLFSPKIRWNSVTQKIELQSLAIGGGYMQLYGDIFSTGNGKLKVLDGYGQIVINNTSNKNLTVNRLDTGTGIEGMIKITDTSTKNVDGKPLTTTITLENDVVKYAYENYNSADLRTPGGVSTGSRTGVYNPRADRRLEWLDANIQENDLWSSYTKSCYAGCGWFAGDLLGADPGTRTGGDQTITDLVRPSGELLVDYNYTDSARPDYKLDYTKVISPVTYTAKQTNHYWTDTCVLGICVDDMEYFETTRRWIWSESNYYLHSLNASKGINIEFTGFNEGLLTVNNGSKALDLQGAVRNLTGTTTLTASNISSADTVIVNAKDLKMTANAGSIGTASLVNDDATYLKVNLQTDGQLDAVATGSAAIWEQDGQLAIKRAQAGGIINLKADGDLLNAATGVAVSGSSIRLTSVNGAIGTDTVGVANTTKAMLVNTASATGNLAASAAKDISITESTGDLRLDTVTTLAGDVTLTAMAGNIIDDESEFRVDLETEAELLAVADRAGLFGTKAQDSEDNSVNGYNQAKEQDYATYWQMRNVTKTESETYVADAYDAGYVFTLQPADVTELTDLGWTSVQIDDYKTRQTNLYHAANAKFGAEPYDSEFTYSGIGLDADNVEYTFSDTENLAIVQEYNTYWQLRNVRKDGNDTYSADAYSAAYEFTLTDAQKTDLKTNNGWTDLQVAQYEDSKTSLYHEAYSAFGDGTFDSNFNYDVATQDVAAYDLLTDGTWETGEVTNLVSAGIFKDTADTEVLIENDNVIGKNITLNALGGIGAEKSARVISYLDPSSWDDAERLALVAADRNDVVIDYNNKTFTIRVKDDIDLSLQNSGELTAHAGSDIYIGSEADIRVKEVVAQNNDDVRIKTGAALINVATVGAAAITGGNVTVEAGGADLGSDATPFILNALGSLTARADGDLFVNNTFGDMRIEQVYATNLVKLTSVGGILETPSNHNLTTDIQATHIDLTAATTIGQSDVTGLNYLDIGSDNDGWVDMTAANGIYVYSPAYRLNLRDVTASNGSVNITSAVSSLDVMGDVTGKNGITLDSKEAVWLTENGHLESSDGDINISTSGFRKVVPTNYFDPVDNTQYGFKMDTTSSINSLVGEISISSAYDMLVGPLTGMHGVSLKSTLGAINQLAATQVAAANGDINLEGVGVNILDVNAAGAATVIAGVNGINVQNTLQATEEIDMSSTGSIEVLDSAQVQTTLAINMRANDDISLTGGKVVATAGAITLTAGQDGTGQILVEAQTADGIAIDSGATLEMTAANNIVIQGKTHSVGDTHFAAGDDLHLAGGSLVTQGAVTFTAGTDGSGDLLVDEETTGEYAVDTTSTLDMTAANAMLIKGRIRALGNTNMTANDDVRFAGGSLTTDEPLNVTAGEDGTGSIYIETTTMDTNTLQTAKQMVLTAANDITIDGNLRGEEGLEFNAGDAVNIISGSVYTNDKVNIASNDSLTIGGELFGGLGVNLTTPNDVVFTGGSIGSDNDVTIKAGTDGSGSVLGGRAEGTDIVALGILDIQATDVVGGEFALEAQVATQANFRASDINVDVTNKPVDHSLLLSVSDIGGGPSNSVMMNVASNNAVYFDTFNAVIAEITADAPSLQVPQGHITNYAVFNMPFYNTRFDTLSRDAHPGYDVNAYTIDGNFTLDALTSSVDVGSYIINRNPLLEWTGDVPADVVSASNEVMQVQPAGNTPVAQDPKKINVWGSTASLAKNLYSGVTLVTVSGDWFNAITPVETQAESQNSENIEEIEN